MSLVSDLVKIPYLMQPGLKKIELSDIWLSPEPHNKSIEHIKQVCKTSLPESWTSDVFYTLLPYVQGSARDALLTKELFNPGLLTTLQFMHKMLREDIIVMNARGELELLYVSTPSGWAPEKHLGVGFDEIDKRLPDADHIQKASSHLVKLVTGEQAFQRTVWTLSPSPERNRHPTLAASQATWDTTDKAYFRYETQTFVPFQPGERVIFLIDVNVIPLESACKTYEDVIKINAALETMSDSVRKYKGLDNTRVGSLVRDVMDIKFGEGV